MIPFLNVLTLGPMMTSFCSSDSGNKKLTAVCEGAELLQLSVVIAVDSPLLDGMTLGAEDHGSVITQAVHAQATLLELL